jgi:hypothetical protein
MLCAGDDSFIDCRGGSGLNFRLDDTTGDTQRIKFHSGGNVFYMVIPIIHIN